MYTQITLEEALSLVAEACSPLPPEETDLAQSLGRPLVEDATARRDLPPFDRAPVAGYALRAADLSRANHKRPAFLQVVDMVRAGKTASIPVAPGQAVRLEEGAPLPDGCDCVVPLGDTDGGTETVAVHCQLWPFDNIQRQGQLAAGGTVLCPAGMAPDVAMTALLRAAGVHTVPLRPLARMGVLTVGDQLAPAQTSILPPAQVPDFNRLYLSECWADQVEGVLDQWRSAKEEDIMAGCKELLGSGLSLLVTAGEPQQVAGVLAQLGAEPIFHQIMLRGQGETTALRYRQSLVLALPGNPFSAGVAARLLVPAALAALGENPSLLPRRRTLRLAAGVAQSRPERRLLPARLGQDGAILILEGDETPTALCGMAALVDIPAGARPAAGDPVTALLLP